MSLVTNTISLKPSFCHKLLVIAIESYTINAHFSEMRCSGSPIENNFTEIRGSWNTRQSELGLPISQVVWNSAGWNAVYHTVPNSCTDFPFFCHFHKRPKKTLPGEKSENVLKGNLEDFREKPGVRAKMGGSPKQSQMGGVHAQGKREAAGRPGAGNCRKGAKPCPRGLEITRPETLNRNAQNGKTQGSNENLREAQ